MKQIWITLFGFIQKEIRQTLRDPRMRLVLFIAPIIQLTIFGFALSTETRNIRLAAIYRPDDNTAREIVTHSLASKWFIPTEVKGHDPYDADQADNPEGQFWWPPKKNWIAP